MDSAISLVDRTQQLLDEVDQLLGVAPETDDSVSGNDDVDLGDSVEALKKFLSDLGETSDSSGDHDVADCEADVEESIKDEVGEHEAFGAEESATEVQEIASSDSEEVELLVEDDSSEVPGDADAETSFLIEEDDTETDCAIEDEVESQASETECSGRLGHSESMTETETTETETNASSPDDSQEDAGFDLEAFKTSV